FAGGWARALPHPRAARPRRPNEILNREGGVSDQVKSVQDVASPPIGRAASWIPAIRDRATSERFRPYLLVLILMAALAFPYLDHNEGDIDAAANALAFAML